MSERGGDKKSNKFIRGIEGIAERAKREERILAVVSFPVRV